MPDANDDHHEPIVVDLVQNAVVAHPYAPDTLWAGAYDKSCTLWSWILSESSNRATDSLLLDVRELLELTPRALQDQHGVRVGHGGTGF